MARRSNTPFLPPPPKPHPFLPAAPPSSLPPAPRPPLSPSPTPKNVSTSPHLPHNLQSLHPPSAEPPQYIPGSSPAFPGPRLPPPAPFYLPTPPPPPLAHLKLFPCLPPKLKSSPSPRPFLIFWLVASLT